MINIKTINTARGQLHGQHVPGHAN